MWYDVSAIDAHGKQADIGQYKSEELDRGDHIEEAKSRKLDYSSGFVAEPARYIALGYSLREEVATGRIFDGSTEVKL